VIVAVAMFAFLTQLLFIARSRLKSRASLVAENLGSASAGGRFKPQVPVASAAPKHRSAYLGLAVPLLPVDSECNRHSQAGAVIRWHRRGFRAYWRWKSSR
jgi:hypothetical protein